MTARPSLSVIVPVLNGIDLLPRCVEALEASDLSRDEWDLLIVDDGSTDGTPDWASEHADSLVSVEGGPLGPGFARNLGAERAAGDVLVFVDADVCVHADALRRFQAAFSNDDVGAAFGAYDDSPAAEGFWSQYRNLYHRYVHLNGAGPTETFWAGCGAVRRPVFQQLGGFDTDRYPRPQIEDIELGYRIRDAGHLIVLDPSIQGTHLKRWTFANMIKTDLFDRGVPWMRLMLGGGPAGARPSLNVGRAEKLKTALMGLSCLGLLVSVGLLSPLALGLTLLPLLLIVLMNWPIFRWFARRRGWTFALKVVPVNLLYYLLNGVAVVLGAAGHFLSRSERARTSTRATKDRVPG